MEAVPRLPMLSFELKKPGDKYEPFLPKLKDYIQDHYNEDGEMFASQINQLENLRSAAARPSCDVTGCTSLQKYYCQLHYLASRFPMSEGGVASINFSWKLPYSSNFCSAQDIKHEMAGVLYNIGAMHTQLGAKVDRSSPEGMKMACSHFQCAAWAFETVLEEYPIVVFLGVPPDFYRFMRAVSFAQAQECILEKSMLDNRKASITVKIAIQTVDYYSQALKILNTNDNDKPLMELLSSKIKKKWESYLKFKMCYYRSVAYLFQGQQAEELTKMGERVAYYQAAFDKLEETKSLTKGLDDIDAVHEALLFLRDVVEGKRKSAKNDNEFIYHEAVPSLDSLPEVKGAPLARACGFDVSDVDIAGPDIFSRLVPLKAHESSSVYSEELAKLLRKTTGDVVEAETALESFLSSLNVDELNITDWELPQEVIDRCAALSVKPNAVKNVLDSLEELNNTYQDVENMITEIKAILKREEEEVEGYENVVGKRPPSIAATDLTREANKYQDAHQKASESNQTLNKAIRLHMTNLALLSLPIYELEQKIPQVKLDASEEEALNQMKLLMNKVNEMTQQRSLLVSQFREAINRDDITHKIVTFTGESLSELFQQEIAKHQAQVNIINQNIAAQDNIISAIQDTYAKYGMTRQNIRMKIQRRDAMVAGLIASFDAYEDLLAKSKKGMEFYTKLQGNVSKLLKRVKSTCKVQEEEREQVLSNIRGKSSNPSPPHQIHNDIGSGGNLKLKDYLNMKKETGKMSLVDKNPATPAYVVPQYDATWVPGIRPAPVGQEQNEVATSRQSDMGRQPYANNLYYPDTNKLGSDYKTPYAPQYNTNYTNPAAAADNNQHVPAPSPAPNQTSSLYQQYHVPSQPISQLDYSYQPTNSTNPYPTDYTSSTYNTSTNQSYSGSSYSQPTVSSSTNLPLAYQYSTAYPQQSVGYSYTDAPPSRLQQGAAYPTSTPDTSYQQVSSLGYSQPNYEASLSTQAYIPPTNYPASNSSATGYLQNSMYYAETGSLHPSLGNPQNTTAYQANATSAQVLYPGQTYPTSDNPQTTFQTATIPAQTTNFSYPPDPSKDVAVANSQQPTSFSTSFQPMAGQAYPATELPSGQTSLANTQQPQNFSANYQPIATTPNPVQPYLTTDPAPAVQQPQTFSTTYQSTGSATNQNPVQPYPNTDPASAVQQPQTFSATYQPTGSAANQNPVQPYSTTEQPLNNQVPISNYQPTFYSNQQVASQPYATSDPSSTVPYPQSYEYSTYPAASQQSTWAGNYIPPQATGYGSQNSQYMQSGNASLYTQTGQQQAYTPVSSNVLYSTPTKPTDIPFSNSSHSQQYQGSNNVIQSPVTYQQAGFGNVSTTNVGNQLKSSVSSNVDLLAGLEVDVNQSPLLPQTLKKDSPVKNVDVEAVKKEEGKKEDTFVKKEEQVVKKEVAEREIDADCLKTLAVEVEKFGKFVEGLTLKTLNGPTSLDLKWKELIDLQEKGSHLRSISVARCYPMKNRFPDILPYDESRIELPSTKDDYINASLLKPITDNMVPLILTQAPLPVTYGDFWTMVLEQQVEVVVCLLSDAELGGHVYWPEDKMKDMALGKMRLSLQTCNVRQLWVERILSISGADGKSSRVVVHLQFTAWPGSSFPVSPGAFLTFVHEVKTFIEQQRSRSHPCVVHCLSGVGRTGLFALAYASMLDIPAGKGIPDLVQMTSQFSQARKNVLRDREHLKYAYQTILYFCQDFLLKRGILTSTSSMEEKKSKDGRCHTRHPSQDYLLSACPENVSKQMENLQVDEKSSESKPEIQSSVESNVMPPGRSSPLAAAMDPNVFNLSPQDNKVKAKPKFTAESFIKPSSSISSTTGDDPFSSLDPLWSLKK